MVRLGALSSVKQLSTATIRLWKSLGVTSPSVDVIWWRWTAICGLPCLARRSGFHREATPRAEIETERPLIALPQFFHLFLSRPDDILLDRCDHLLLVLVLIGVLDDRDAKPLKANQFYGIVHRKSGYRCD
jgi:hypothetical protein